MELLNKVQEQVFFEEMPPKKKKKQPTEAECGILFEWVSGQLKLHGASKLEETLERPEFGNYVDHDKLFSGEYKDLPGFTRDRRWLISEFIFNATVNQLINHPSERTIDGERVTVVGDNGVNIGTRFGGGSLRQSITNPFLLPSNIGVRYYDNTAQKAGFNASVTNTPIRKLWFFREFFGYTKALTLFKDNERFNAAWTSYDDVKGRLVDETDMLVDHILRKDENVFEELLTTEKFYVFHSGDNEAMQASSERLRKIYDYFKGYDWQNFSGEQLYEHWDFINEMKVMGTVFPDFINSKRKEGWLRSFKTLMTSYTLRFGNRQKAAAPYDAVPLAYWNKGEAAPRTGTRMRGEDMGRLYNVDYTSWD